jgi:hypothetical protein
LLVLIGALYFLVALVLQAPIRRAAGGGDWLDAIFGARTLFAAMVLIPLFVLFAGGHGLLTRLALGVPHALAHLALVLAAVGAWALAWDRYGIVVAALAALVATPLGGALVGLYLAVADWLYGLSPERLTGLDRHANEAFSCQGIEDWKSFLRFHVGRDGRLTIYPVGIERAARSEDLTFNDEQDPSAPYFRVSGRVRPQLIEDPIVCE